MIEKPLNNQTGSSAIQSPIKMGSLGGLGGGLPLSLLAICATDTDWAYTMCKAVCCENSMNIARFPGGWINSCSTPGLCYVMLYVPHLVK